MTSFENFFQLLDSHTGVEARGLEILVSQKLLDMPQVGSSLKKMSRAGVPEGVRVHPL